MDFSSLMGGGGGAAGGGATGPASSASASNVFGQGALDNNLVAVIAVAVLVVFAMILVVKK